MIGRTTEAGGGVPQELRERLVQSVWLRYNRVICDELTSVFGEPVVTDDEIMAEIAAAGFKMVPADAIVLAPCEPEVLMPGFDPDEYDLEGRG
jgi:hypothetical protein